MLMTDFKIFVLALSFYIRNWNKTDSHTFKELKAMQDTDLKVSVGDTACTALFLLKSFKLSFCPSVT